MKYLVVEASCAECRWALTEPLIRMYGPFDTIEEAKGPNKNITWAEHPQGGWFTASGQGDSWIVEVSDDFVVTPYPEGD